MPALPAPELRHSLQPLGLRVEDVEVTSPEGRSLLRVPELTLPPGQSVAITGPSGAGKSTLLHVLGGLLRPSAGRVIWGGRDIVPLSDEARTAFRRDHVGMIFQDFLLFEELDALGNAALPAAFAPRARRADLTRRAQGWLDRLGLVRTGRRRVETFSGGERQRIAVARALFNQPGVILADEPTASLDRGAADRLIADLVELSQREACGLIAVTHDPGLSMRLDRHLRLEDGQIVEDSHA